MVRSICLLLALSLLPSFISEGFADPHEGRRANMVASDIRGRGVTDRRVLKAMREVPRHLFVPPEYRDRAYGDFPLPIGQGQTISQPYMVALMTEALGLSPGDKVLEIGTGSGYQAAVLAEIVDEVYTVEIRKALADSARKRLEDLDYSNIRVRNADGYNGWEEYAPYDAIIITAAANHIPPPLIKQLAEGGRLIIPLGNPTYFQVLTLATKIKEGLQLRQMLQVSFVPMVGEAEKGN